MVTTSMTVMMVVHIILVAIMIGLILLQKSEGGALGMGGGSGFMSARGTANLLTRSTAVLATLFFISTLVLAIMFKGSTNSDSILDLATQAPTPAVSMTPAAPQEPQTHSDANEATNASPNTPSLADDAKKESTQQTEDAKATSTPAAAAKKN